jgi:hypothetical protein
MGGWYKYNNKSFLLEGSPFFYIKHIMFGTYVNPHQPLGLPGFTWGPATRNKGMTTCGKGKQKEHKSFGIFANPHGVNPSILCWSTPPFPNNTPIYLQKLVGFVEHVMRTSSFTSTCWQRRNKTRAKWSSCSLAEEAVDGEFWCCKHTRYTLAWAWLRN